MKEKTRKLILSSVLIAGLTIGTVGYLLKPTQSAMQVTSSQQTTQDSAATARHNAGTVAAGSKPDTSTGSNAVSAALAVGSSAQSNAAQVVQAVDRTSTQATAQTVAYGMNDGNYTGRREYVFYGYVRVEAIIQNGRLKAVRVLEHPSDNGRSRYINSVAMPYLVQEAIQAQSANVSLISGATLSSEGFVKSLSSALSRAGA